MSIMIDRKYFFESVKNTLFRGKLSQAQVTNMDNMITEFENRKLENKEWLAYMLATAYHETGTTMQPVREKGSGDGPDPDKWDDYLQKYDTGKLAKSLGNTPEADGDGVLYAGRGYVQLTGRANYKRFSDIVEVDLIANPDLALEPSIATKIMFSGMLGGLFTGKRLLEYFDGEKHGWVNARKIINGLDCADKIANYGRLFNTALRVS